MAPKSYYPSVLECRWPVYTTFLIMYKGELVSRSQMDIKRKTCDIRKREKIFLGISSSNIDTLVPSLYQCVETRSLEVYWLLSQPLPYLRFNLFVISEMFAIKVEPLYATNTSQHKQETFLYEYLCIESFYAHRKRTTGRCFSVIHSSSAFTILTSETSLWTCACSSAT
jgi:hypothetical protein